MAAAAIPIATMVGGALISKKMAPKAPTTPLKSKEQLEAEQKVKVDSFEQRGKTRKTSSATSAGNTRAQLLGNLGGTQSKLGVNPVSSIMRGMGG